MQISEFDKARLWSKVYVPRKMAEFDSDVCWERDGANVEGRSQIVIDGQTYYASRIVWEIFFGDPGDSQVCHTCDNPSCVNPKHLFLGTASENQTDCVIKGRKKAKMTPDIVRAIRKECIPNHKTLGFSALARKYNVNPGAIWNAFYRRRWNHVEDTPNV